MAMGMAIGFGPNGAATWAIGLTATLWGFCFYLTKPVPPPVDEARLVQLDQAIKDQAKQLDSLKTAVNMRQLR